MAALASTDVTYTLVPGTAKANPADPRAQAVYTIAFGDGALTYPSGGVPLLKAKLGCPTVIDELYIIDAANANGYMYKYDLTNNKFRIYQGDNDQAGDTAGIELLTSIAPAAASIKVKVVGW